MSTIGQQAAAVEAAQRIIVGAAVKPSAQERAYLSERLLEAALTIRRGMAPAQSEKE